MEGGSGKSSGSEYDCKAMYKILEELKDEKKKSRVLLSGRQHGLSHSLLRERYTELGCWAQTSLFYI